MIHVQLCIVNLDFSITKIDFLLWQEYHSKYISQSHGPNFGLIGWQHWTSAGCSLDSCLARVNLVWRHSSCSKPACSTCHDNHHQRIRRHHSLPCCYSNSRQCLYMRSYFNPSSSSQLILELCSGMGMVSWHLKCETMEIYCNCLFQETPVSNDI